ncbi:MAG: DNRLRE domain-containing protein [bacterium]
MRIKSALLWSAVLAVSGLLFGCEQKDSSVGSGLAPGLNDIFLQEALIDPIGSNYYQAQVPVGSNPYLYLGAEQGYNADALLKFNPYGSLPDSFTVDSLVVKLYLDSVSTTGSDPLDVSVYFVNRTQEWTESEVFWDTLDSLQLGNAVASFSITAAPTDTDSVSFALPAPDSLLRAWEWIGSGDKTLHYNNGLYLLSQKSMSFMARFFSSEYSSFTRRPKLEMYVTVVDTSDTTGAAPVDTMLFTYATQDAFIAQDQSVLDESYLYLGNSIAFWSLLWFPLADSFPTFGIGVHRAEVVLHADTSSVFNVGEITKAYAVAMQDTSWLQNPKTAPLASGMFSSPSGYYDSNAATLTLNLTQMVTDWIAKPETNNGFLIISVNEYSNLTRTVFFGVSAADSLRPRLRIIYLEGEP